MHSIDIDEKLRGGKVSREIFRRLLDAEIYGTATPMQWLEKRLKLLEKILISGKEIEIESDEGNQLIKTQDDFYIWCENHFPDAFVCFFQDQEITK